MRDGRDGRTLLGAAAAFLAAALIVPAAAHACEISFDPSELAVGADGKGTVKVLVKWEHRKCVLEDDELNIDASGATILKTTGWEKVKRGLFQNTVDFELTAAKGKIRVWRECSKKGISEWEAPITRK